MSCSLELLNKTLNILAKINGDKVAGQGFINETVRRLGQIEEDYKKLEDIPKGD